MLYDKPALRTAQHQIDSFIHKAYTDRPMLGFKQTGVIAELKENMRGGLTRQAMVFADRLRHLNDPGTLPDTFEELTTDQLTRLSSFIVNNLPRLSNFVSSDAIYVKKKAAFEWGIGAQYQRWGAGSLKLRNTGDVLRKASMSFYRGEETGMAGFFHTNGTNLLGDALYVADNEVQARMFGDSVSQYSLKLKAKDIYQIKTDADLDKVYNGALRKFPGEDTQKSIPKYIKSLGYKAAQVASSVEPRGGVAVFDQKVIDSAKVTKLPNAGAATGQEGFISIGGNNFNVSNTQYIGALKSSTNYLLQKSSLDDVTRKTMIDTIAKGKALGLTNDEVADLLMSDEYLDIADWRADMIARTETANAMMDGQLASMQENGVKTKAWVVAGPGCTICDPNEDDGFIDIDSDFSSGDDSPPAHPNCECYLDSGMIDLESIDIWGGE